jgi:hypothetical protein
VLACWIIKNLAAFLCYAYLVYVVVVQFGRANIAIGSGQISKKTTEDLVEEDCLSPLHHPEMTRSFAKRLDYENVKGLHLSDNWKH